MQQSSKVGILSKEILTSYWLLIASNHYGTTFGLISPIPLRLGFEDNSEIRPNP